MTDIVWLLRNDVPCNGDIDCARELCNQAADEIDRLRAEVETWVGKAKTAIWSDSEECKLLTADNERLRQVLENSQQARVLQGKAIIDAVNEIDRLRAALERAASELDDLGAYAKANSARSALEFGISFFSLRLRGNHD